MSTRYRGPMIPTRIAANVRKRAIVEGTFGSFIPHIGMSFISQSFAMM